MPTDKFVVRFTLHDDETPIYLHVTVRCSSDGGGPHEPPTAEVEIENVEVSHAMVTILGVRHSLGEGELPSEMLSAIAANAKDRLETSGFDRERFLERCWETYESRRGVPTGI